MNGIIVYGSDKALAQVYYLVFQRVDSAEHRYRKGSSACYACNDDSAPALIQAMEDLGVSYHALGVENRDAIVFQLIEALEPDVRITTRYLMENTGYTYHHAGRAMQKLVDAGFVKSFGRCSGRYYLRCDAEDKT